MRHRQRGISLIGLLIVGALAAFILLLGFRSVPAFTEYFAIQRIVRAIAEEGDGGANMAALRKSFERRSVVDDITSVTAADLEIYKDGGKVVVDAAWERRVPIAGNVSLLIEFSASSSGL